MDIHSVGDMVAQFKAFGAAKVSFHQNGQQVIDFQDDTHATSICYGIATLADNKDGPDKVTAYALRYFDTYEQIDGRWWITARKQYFLYTLAGEVTIY